MTSYLCGVQQLIPHGQYDDSLLCSLPEGQYTWTAGNVKAPLATNNSLSSFCLVYSRNAERLERCLLTSESHQ